MRKNPCGFPSTSLRGDLQQGRSRDAKERTLRDHNPNIVESSSELYIQS